MLGLPQEYSLPIIQSFVVFFHWAAVCFAYLLAKEFYMITLLHENQKPNMFSIIGASIACVFVCAMLAGFISQFNIPKKSTHFEYGICILIVLVIPGLIGIGAAAKKYKRLTQSEKNKRLADIEKNRDNEM